MYTIFLYDQSKAPSPAEEGADPNQLFGKNSSWIALTASLSWEPLIRQEILISDVLMVVGAAGLGYAAVAALSRLIHSPTKGDDNRLVISGRYIKPGQRIVIVDDFLANGRTAAALIDMAREAGGQVLGAGFVVEKCFKHGRQFIESLGVPVSTLAQVEHLESGRAILTQPEEE